MVRRQGLVHIAYFSIHGTQGGELLFATPRSTLRLDPGTIREDFLHSSVAAIYVHVHTLT